MDVVTAYLNSELKEEIYITPPKGSLEAEKKEKVWKLKRAMYGLKRTSMEWHNRQEIKEIWNAQAKCRSMDIYKKGEKQDSDNRYVYRWFINYK